MKAYRICREKFYEWSSVFMGEISVSVISWMLRKHSGRKKGCVAWLWWWWWSAITVEKYSKGEAHVMGKSSHGGNLIQNKAHILSLGSIVNLRSILWRCSIKLTPNSQMLAEIGANFTYFCVKQIHSITRLGVAYWRDSNTTQLIPLPFGVTWHRKINN